MRSPIQELAAARQSAWLDNINRQLLESGRLKEMISQGLRGLTSNPTIFEKAICNADTYNAALEAACRKGLGVFDIYDELTCRDIQDAADEFRAVYEATGGLDGYVSLEINPLLAHQTAQTIAEGKRLHAKVARPNLMLKVPATEAGFPAIVALLASGMNVNVTLIFSTRQYLDTVRAYKEGMRLLIASGGDPRAVRSVASVFVSRLDTVADGLLEKRSQGAGAGVGVQAIERLKGSAALAHMAGIYRLYQEAFEGPDFAPLREAGVGTQRVLWASTSTKNARYSDIKYVTELIAPDTVNTMPQATFEAFLDHGIVGEGLKKFSSGASQTLLRMREQGVDVEEISAALLRDGIKSFIDSFQSLLASIEKKSACALGR